MTILDSCPHTGGLDYPFERKEYNRFDRWARATLACELGLAIAAEALRTAHKQRELAGVILKRLKSLLLPSESAATIFERLGLHFTEALQILLAGKGPTFNLPPAGDEPSALQLMQDMSPYTSFGHFTANQSILEAVNGSRRVHIIDFDVKEGLQWASLMQALVSDKNGTFTSHSLRITAIAGGKSTVKVEETGQRLTAFASSVNLPFTFGHCKLGLNQRFRPAALKPIEGEAIILNCVLHSPQAPHRSAAYIKSFISSAAAVGASLVTVVEEESGGRKAEGFMGRFVDEMERYWVMMEAVEQGFQKQRRARKMVEREIFAPRIVAAVSRVCCEEEGGGGGVGEWMAGGGFRRVGFSGFNVSLALMLVKLFGDGYEVEEDGSNKLVLRWKWRRLVSSSAWSPATMKNCL
ncbi:nodulation-signaling pathway 2 protein-like [Phalaenopsis equestris]|uniref:nodulation-signaling pathway 2 protein-like n=1 Tax=Phalaenopsis equestris TaxID=78828 RepID=UPI0009E523AC|nr:nodulation-signaling pathway 2 protein-like [Phalaenopsis equestris]